MLNKSSLNQIAPLVLAMTLGIASGTQALATKMTTPPLPSEREEKDFSSGRVLLPASGSKFPRRLDYRDEEKLQKAKDAEALKKAEQDKADALAAAKRNSQLQVENVQKYAQMAIDANNNAVVFGKQGRWIEAINAHEKACEYDPRNKQFVINLSAARTAYGQQRFAAGDFASAAVQFRKALAIASDNSVAAKKLGESLSKQGIDPGNSDQRIEVGDKLLAGNDLQGAAIEYGAATQIEPSARTYQKMGDLYLRYNQMAQAMNYYRQAIVKDADYGPAHRQLGFLHMTRGDFTSAAASLRKAVICDSKDSAAGQALVELWRKQVATNPLLAENHLGLAGAMQLTGDFNGAETEYRKLEALDPKNPSLESGRASLGRAYQHAKAEKHKTAADTLSSQGLRREALGEINQAVMLEPRNAKYHFLMGECLEGIGDYAGANKSYLTCVLIDPEMKEAAARMKDLQKSMNMTGANVSQMSNQIANQLTGQMNPGNQPQQQIQQPQFQPQQPQQQFQQPQQQQQAQAPQQEVPGYQRKNMFEGASGQQNFGNRPLNFRTHEESDSQQAAQPAQQAQPQQQASAAGSEAPTNMNDAMGQVTYLESQKDYPGAANILRQMLNTNLESAELHHRLAVNLLAAGQISEAIPEFRIASALKPTQKMYSDDLARAMQINKRSLMSDKSDSSVSGSK